MEPTTILIFFYKQVAPTELKTICIVLKKVYSLYNNPVISLQVICYPVMGLQF